MNAQQLKNSILQMAVQGKLVPQDPNDEPASVLLERIRKEKEQLIKEGKIKKERNPSYIFRGADNTPYEKIGNTEPLSIADEIPFDIPDSWEWVRLNTIMTLYNGRAYKRQELLQEGKYPVLRVGNLFTNNSWYFSNLELEENKYIETGDLIYAWSASFGPFIWNGEKCIYHYHIWKMKYSHHIYREYLYYFLLAETARIKAGGHGLSMQHVTKEGMEHLIIPIPPYNEQLRIVDKIRKIEPYLLNYSRAEGLLDALNEGFPDQLKKSILQMAVQGKLIPQDPNDEPASVLLDRIRAEKERLISQGRIKPDKNESVIFRRDNSHYEKLGPSEHCIDDEIPFEIPESWCWYRLGEVFQHNTGKALNSANQSGELSEYITTSNLYWNRFELNNLRSMYFTETEIDKCTAKAGDLLVCEGGDIGRAAIWNYDYDIRIQNHIHRLRAYTSICIKYFYYLFYFYKNTGMIGGKGIGIQGLSSNAIHQILLPVPPVKEQYRIVQEIEQLFPYCEKL